MSADLLEARLTPGAEIAHIREFVTSLRRITNQWSRDYKSDAVFWLLPKNEDAEAIYSEYPFMAHMVRCKNAKFFCTKTPIDGLISAETNLGTVYVM